MGVPARLLDLLSFFFDELSNRGVLDLAGVVGLVDVLGVLVVAIVMRGSGLGIGTVALAAAFAGVFLVRVGTGRGTSSEDSESDSACSTTFFVRLDGFVGVLLLVGAVELAAADFLVERGTTGSGAGAGSSDLLFLAGVVDLDFDVGVVDLDLEVFSRSFSYHSLARLRCSSMDKGVGEPIEAPTLALRFLSATGDALVSFLFIWVLSKCYEFPLY